VPTPQFLAPRHTLDSSRGNSHAVVPTVYTAGNDAQALQAWIEARAGLPEDPSFSATTAKAYRIEGMRLLRWCVLERHKAQSAMAAVPAAGSRHC
jgi:isoaspartyl peptidase/L-asparaginase-like protein (Ntn-hydrolase superfamily)